MPVINTKEPVILAAGDLFIMVASLLLTLVLRYNGLLTHRLLAFHAVPFAIVFLYSLVIFYISGLYGRMIAIARSSVPGTVIKAQIAAGLIAVLLFYLAPGFTVTPKLTLFIYIALSTALLILWRIGTYPLLSLRRKYPALVIGSGPEAEELIREMAVSPRIGLVCRKRIDPGASVETLIHALEGSSTFQYIVADVSDARLNDLLPELYRRFFSKAQIIDLYDLYENVFQRIPLSCMNYAWIMSHVSSAAPKTYDALKRAIDVVFGVIVGIAACVAYPFVALALKIQDHGPVLISQERTGKGGEPMHYYKFRSMQRNESGKWVKESGAGDNRVTPVGRFIRKTRIDELPQALAILKGDMSLIGPRADIAGLDKRLEAEIPYYPVRTVIKPGLTGWAQINQAKPPQSVEETKLRLSYDLYYIKHRSLALDMSIILKTFRTLLSREGM